MSTAPIPTNPASQTAPNDDTATADDATQPPSPTLPLRTKLLRALHLQPITPLFLVVFAGSLLGLQLLAGPRMDFVVMVMGYVGLALCALSLLCTIPAAVLLHRAVRDRGPLNTTLLEAQSPIVTGMHIPNFWWLPLLSVEWQWTQPDGATVTQRARGWRRVEEVTFLERGKVPTVLRLFTVSDVLGLARIRWVHTTEQPLTILPNPGKMRQMPVIQAFQSGDQIPHPSGQPEGDRHELRRYTYGQSARHIVWKIYSRTKRLIVREPERAVSRSTNTSAFIIAHPGDEPSSAAARVAVESNSLGTSWILSADGAETHASRPPQALDLIAQSAQHRDLSGSGLPPFAELARSKGFGRCIVFAPHNPGPWLGRVLHTHGQHPDMIEVVIGVDSIQSTPKIPWYQALFQGTPNTAQTTLSADPKELLDIVNELLKVGIATRLIDRQNGRPLSPATLRALQPPPDASA